MPKIEKKYLLLMILICLVIVSGVIMEFMIMNSQRILPGVYIGDLNVSGMEKDQIGEEVIPLYQNSMARNIVILGGEKKWSFTPAQLGVKEDREKTIITAWKIGREGYFWQRWYARWVARRNSSHLPLAFQIDENNLTNHISEMAQNIDQEAKNAGVFIKSNHQVEILSGENGLEVKVNESVQALKEVLLSGDKTECSIITQVIKPLITKEVAASWEINGVVAQYETFFNAAKEDRSANIKVSAMALDHVLVMPQEVFSFNEVVGPRTKEAGYKESLVIENNEFTPGIGGGVCQVSTTLYNAILLANFPIVERHSHSLPITYVEPGRDATVSYDWADLKFINDRKKPVLLHTEYQKGKVKVLIFGTQGEYQKVKIISKIVEYINAEEEIIKDPSLAPGQTLVEAKGQQGMVVEVYREFTSDGSLTRELISRDKYKPQKAVIRVPLKPVIEPLEENDEKPVEKEEQVEEIQSETENKEIDEP